MGESIYLCLRSPITDIRVVLAFLLPNAITTAPNLHSPRLLWPVGCALLFSYS